MEYQDYELTKFEGWQKDLENAQASLVAARKVLVEAGISAFEEIQELNLAQGFHLAVEYGGEESRAKHKCLSAMRKLKMAEKRLQIAESDVLGETIEQATWVGLFLKEAEAARVRRDNLPKLGPRPKGHNKDGGMPPMGTKEYKEWWEEENMIREAEGRQHKEEVDAWLGVKLANQGLVAARSDDLGEVIERAALIRMTRNDVRSAQAQVEEEKASMEKLDLEGNVLGSLNTIRRIKEKMKRHNILLKWIEQQRRDSFTDVENEGNRGRSMQARSRALRRQPAKAARHAPSAKEGYHTRQPTTRSTPIPINPTKVSKVPRGKRGAHQKLGVSYNALPERATTDPNPPEPGIQPTSTTKATVPNPLRPLPSSRISKSGGRQPKGLRMELLSPDGRPGPQRKSNVGRASRGRRMMPRSANVSLRRSTRISKPPERFCPVGT